MSTKMEVKKTIAQIKAELDNLGIKYKYGLKKAELLGLLEKSQENVVDSHYSPPYTRRRTTMSRSEIANARTLADVKQSELERSPVNHASAVIEELEEKSNKSEEASIDVQITEELTPIKEQIANELPGFDLSSDSSVQSASELSDIEVLPDTEIVLTADIELTPEAKVATRAVTKRRSERLTRKHVACEGVLFSDTEPELKTPDCDNVSTTSSEEVVVSTRRHAVLKIFLISVLFVLLANAIAYLHISNPDTLHKIQAQLTGLIFTSEQQSDPVVPPVPAQ